MSSESSLGRFEQWVGARAHRPAVAAALVGMSAVVFSALWAPAILLVVSPERLGETNPFPLQVFSGMAVGNAIVVTGGIWTLLVARSDRTLTGKRGAVVGTAIGLTSYLTLGMLVASLFLVLEGGVRRIGDVVTLVYGYTYFALLFTLGIPIALAAAVGWYIGRAHERTGDRAHRNER